MAIFPMLVFFAAGVYWGRKDDFDPMKQSLLLGGFFFALFLVCGIILSQAPGWFLPSLPR